MFAEIIDEIYSLVLTGMDRTITIFLAWLGLAWLGLAWLGLAWLGLAWLGLAWLGLAWLGSARRILSDRSQRALCALFPILKNEYTGGG